MILWFVKLFVSSWYLHTEKADSRSMAVWTTEIELLIVFTYDYTWWATKACHYIFDYNSGTSRSIFIISALLKTVINTPYKDYRMSNFIISV